MSIVGGFDVHRKQITFDYLDTVTGEVQCGQIVAADRGRTLKSVMTGQDETGATIVSFWFHFDWRLPSGAAAPFDVVDVATLAPDGKIKDLQIIYDTVDVRPVFEADVGRSSWRRSNP